MTSSKQIVKENAGKAWKMQEVELTPLVRQTLERQLVENLNSPAALTAWCSEEILKVEPELRIFALDPDTKLMLAHSTETVSELADGELIRLLSDTAGLMPQLAKEHRDVSLSKKSDLKDPEFVAQVERLTEFARKLTQTAETRDIDAASDARLPEWTRNQFQEAPTIAAQEPGRVANDDKDKAIVFQEPGPPICISDYFRQQEVMRYVPERIAANSGDSAGATLGRLLDMLQEPLTICFPGTGICFNLTGSVLHAWLSVNLLGEQKVEGPAHIRMRIELADGGHYERDLSMVGQGPVRFDEVPLRRILEIKVILVLQDGQEIEAAIPKPLP